MFRTVVALVGGFAIYAFATILFIVVVTIAMPLTSAEAGAATLLVNLLPWLFAGALGGYAATALARRSQRAHGAGLAVMVLVACASQIGHPQAGQPRWYPVAITVLATAGALAGVFLRTPRTPTVPTP